MYLSEFPGPHLGCRDAAIEGHQIISRRALDLGVDTVVVFDVHWLVNSGYHINCGDRFRGVYTSHEMPHFIKDMEYDYRGNPALGRLIAQSANERGLKAFAHQIASLELEYGTLLPMRYMNSDDRFSLVSVAAWCAWHSLDESRVFGRAVRDAIERSSDTVMVLASGSLSHRFHNNQDAQHGLFTISREFYRQVDLRVVDLWKSGNFKDFCAMLPEYANLC
jgi:3,4-dihydroxyphenylacetate 2,3-dioxygenase